MRKGGDTVWYPHPFHALSLLVIVAPFEANILVEAVPAFIEVRVRCLWILINHLTMRRSAGSRVRPHRWTGQQHNIPDVEDSNEDTNRSIYEKSDRKICRVAGLQLVHQQGEIAGVYEEIFHIHKHAAQDLVGAVHEGKYVRPSVSFPGHLEEENLDKNKDERVPQHTHDKLR